MRPMTAVEIHCMQGRLLPPEEGRIQAFPASRWADEPALASEAGIDGIEWIYESHGADENPVGSDAGAARLRELEAEHGVRVVSLCADWFMEDRLVEGGEARPEAVEKLRWLVERCAAAGIRRVVVPFVDQSALRDERERDALAGLAEGIAPLLEDAGVELHLETSLSPDEFAALLGRIDCELVRANYDTGNSASLGYDPQEELAAYGERIGSVHVKDRVRGGGTVPLGEGDARLDVVFEGLQRHGWERPLVLQVARGEPGREVEKTAADAEHVRSAWKSVPERQWT